MYRWMGPDGGGKLGLDQIPATFRSNPSVFFQRLGLMNEFAGGRIWWLLRFTRCCSLFGLFAFISLGTSRGLIVQGWWLLRSVLKIRLAGLGDLLGTECNNPRLGVCDSKV